MLSLLKRVEKLTQVTIRPLLCLFLLILVLKQLSLYDRLVGLYQALLPVFGGIIIAFLLQPIIDRVAKHCKRKSAVMVVYVGILLIGGILLVLFIPVLYQQIISFGENLPGWLSQVEVWLGTYNIVLEDLLQYKNTLMEEGYTVIISQLQAFFGSAARYGISFITAFFISIDVDFWKHTARKCIKNYERFSTFYHTMSNIVYQYLVGTILDLSFIAITSWIILSVAGFPNAVLYAMLLALSNLFPYIGPTIGLIVVVFVASLSYTQLPVFSLLLIWIIQQIEANFVQPLIFNKTMDVRPILTFVALFISEALFGIPGVLLSPILASILQIVFRSYLHAKTSNQVGEWEDIWYDFDEAIKGEEEQQKL